MSEQDAVDESSHDDAQKKTETVQLSIRQHKQEKRNAKSLMTRLLNKLAGLISDENSDKYEVSCLMERIEEQKDETLQIIEQLEGAYRENKDIDNASKVSDEADTIVDQVDRETSAARLFLASLVKASSRLSSIADSQTSEQRRAKEQAERNARIQKERIEAEIQKKREDLQAQEKQLKSVLEEVDKRHRELEEEIEIELGLVEKNNASRESQWGRPEIEEIMPTQPETGRPTKTFGDESRSSWRELKFQFSEGIS